MHQEMPLLSELCQAQKNKSCRISQVRATSVEPRCAERARVFQGVCGARTRCTVEGCRFQLDITKELRTAHSKGSSGTPRTEFQRSIGGSPQKTVVLSVSVSLR